MLPQPFGNPSTYAGHSGVDYAKPSRTRVPASGPGMVTFRGWLNDRAAYSVIVDYDGGPTVLYCHFDDLTDVPDVGDRTWEGSTIGRVGNSGNSTGSHLHMEIMEGNGAHTYAGVWRYFGTTVVGSSGGGSKPGRAKRRKTMGLVYYTVDMDGVTQFALAGSSPGTSANWLPTTDQELADDWVRANGQDVAVRLSLPTFVSYQQKFTEPLNVA